MAGRWPWGVTVPACAPPRLGPLRSGKLNITLRCAVLSVDSCLPPLPLLVLVSAALPAYAIPEEDVEGATPKQDTKSGIEQWECSDYFDFDGCGFPATNCIMLTANLHDGTGEVKFDEIVQTTRFEIQGIERRWDWCLNAEAVYECAFVISVDRTGSYYNFRGTGGTVKLRGRFKCAKH